MAEENKPNGAADTTEQQAPQFAIQRIYTKDVSFETPNTPEIFKKVWKPETKLDIDTRSTKLTDDTFEVVLTVTVTVKVEEEVAFLGEVKQAGIFTIGEMPEQAKAHTLGAFCPNILFPYAREAISSLASRGSFPALNLSPVNFDAIFAAYMQKRAEEAKDQPEAAATADA